MCRIYDSWIATLAEATAAHDEETPPVEADLLAQMATSSGTHGPGHRRQAVVERAEGLCAVEHKSGTGEHEPRVEADNAALSGGDATVVYRPMRPTDLPQVKQLHEECFPIKCVFLLLYIFNKK